MNSILTIEKLGVVVVFTLCFIVASDAQIHVDSLKDVGVGTTDPEGAKMKIETIDESKALHIYHNAPDSVMKFGIYNEVWNLGLGAKVGIYNEVRQNNSSSNNVAGINNKVVSGGTGNAYGIYTNVNPTSTGAKYGLYNQSYQIPSATGELRGIYNNYHTGGINRSYGIYNYGLIANPALHDVRGIYNNMTQTSNVMSGDLYGIDSAISPADSTSSNVVYGIKSSINNRGNYGKYGFYTQVIRKSTSIKPIYGVFADVQSEGDTGSFYSIYASAQTTTNDIGYGIYAGVTGDNATNSWAGYFDGNVHCTLGVWQSSDRNLKENIRDFADGLELINHLRPVTYNYRAGLAEGVSDEKQYGFIAQELEEFLPELVKDVRVPGQAIFKTETTEVGDDENGTQPVTTTFAMGEESPTTRMAMNYTALIPILVKAIQEQQEHIRALEQRIEELERR